MVDEVITDGKQIPTQPYDSDDPPKFGQLIETTKDAFIKELSDYFDYRTSDGSVKIEETPNIQKFAFSDEVGDQSLQNVVRLIMAHASVHDQLPLIAITAASFRDRKMGIGHNKAGVVKYPPSIVGANTGPFDLGAGGEMVIRTWPSGDENNPVESTIIFSTAIFSDLSSVTAAEVVRVINGTQALYYTFSEMTAGTLRISAGGLAAVTNPNYIEVISGTASLLIALGFTVGQSDTWTSTENPPMHRYVLAGDMVINIDVIAEDINIRTELCDLVTDFFLYYLDKTKRFQFIGRSYQDRDFEPQEWFHVILQNQGSWGGEAATLKQGGNEQYDYIYHNRYSVPVFTEDFINKKVSEDNILYRDDVVVDETGIEGDYGSYNYRKEAHRSN